MESAPAPGLKWQQKRLHHTLQGRCSRFTSVSQAPWFCFLETGNRAKRLSVSLINARVGHTSKLHLRSLSGYGSQRLLPPRPNLQAHVPPLDSSHWIVHARWFTLDGSHWIVQTVLCAWHSQKGGHLQKRGDSGAECGSDTPLSRTPMLRESRSFLLEHTFLNTLALGEIFTFVKH